MSGFLYGQSEYNLLENSIHLTNLIGKLKEANYDTASLTDSNMYGAYKFLNLCKQNSLKALLGLEIKITNKGFDSKILAYALNLDGYKALVKISSIDKINNHIFTLEELALYKGLYFISTFETSELYNSLLKSNDDFIKKSFEYKNILKHFGIGISLQNKSDTQKARTMYDLALENNISVFPLHQTLYEEFDDFIVYESLKKIGQFSDVKKGDYYIPSKEELSEEFFGFEEVFSNFDKLANYVEDYLPHVSISLPHYPNELNISSKDYLRELCFKGVKRRYAKEHSASFEQYEQRLNYELSIISKMGYDDYFLIVWDYVKYAKKQGYMVGPGRGSACGSLVAYSLGITNVDPLKYDLLFERFLNPERVTMPDIDMDFPDDKRDLVITYVKEKYGVKKVCNISAFGTFQIKSSLRDLGKVMNVESRRLNVLINIASTAQSFEELVDKFKDNQDLYSLLKVAKKIENLPRHISTHAAGIILSSDDLDDLTPLQQGINNLLQAQYEATDLADIGLLKMDFLGIKNLSIVDNCCKEIEGMDNISIQYIPLNDSKTYKLLQDADTLGIFQLESVGIRKVLQKLHPTTIDDIVAVLALYRPGPMDQIDEFIARKHGKPFDYIHKDLAHILKSTYGIIVYQEQIMLIAHDFAGMSLGEADLLRRAVSKKNKDLLDAQRESFVRHCINNGYDKNVGNEIYDYIVKFASYGFNKSHAVGYALLSYQMAYLKANYFKIFMAHILNNVIGNPSLISQYISYAKTRGIKVYPPSVNDSNLSFTSYKDGLIFPLLQIHGIGFVQASNIVNERRNGKYKDLSNLKNRLNLNQNVLEALVYSDALDIFNHTKKHLLEEATNNISAYSKYLGDDIINITESEFDDLTLKKQEAKYLGLNIIYDNFKNINLMHKNYNANYISLKATNTKIRSLVTFESIRDIKTKKGDRMAIGTLTDSRSELGFVIFNRAYEQFNLILNQEDLFLIEGTLTYNKTYNKNELQIDFIQKI
ncbi:MAG: DNA polymerase III subunit alpha [Acholeplasmatales bacterium]|nr:DNA polymerase III subunit alpha [Acholeplasmatales bacterium]